MIDFLSWLNATFYDGLPYAIVTLSFVLTFKYIRFPDVTCAGSFVLGAAVAAATTVYFNVHPVVALGLACIAGALGGGLTAAFHILLRIDRLLAGILSTFVLYAVNLMILKPTLPYGNTPTVLTDAMELDRAIVFGGVAWHPCAILLFAGVVTAAKFFLDWVLASEFGLALRALEDEDAGPVVLRSLNLSPWRFQSFALMVGNALVALSGALVSMKEGAANAHRGFDVLITGLIAFLLGVQLCEWLPSLSEKLAMRRFLQPLRFLVGLRRVRFTTLAAGGSVMYFGIVAFSHRIDVPPELTKLLLAVLVALSVGDYEWLRAKMALRRSRNRVPGVALLDGGHHEISDDRARVITVKSLSYTYPGSIRPALESVSFVLRKGEVVGLRGDNGSGKTTLLKLIAGQIAAPDTGTVCLEELDLTFQPEDRRHRVLYLAQETRTSVIATLTVLENLTLSALDGYPSLLRQAVSGARRERINRSLAEFAQEQLGEQVGASLSGGERQLINLLRMLVRLLPLQVVLLDEPFNNLDPRNIERCVTAIRALHAQGTSVVLVNHAVSVDLALDREHWMAGLSPATQPAGGLEIGRSVR